MCFYYSFKKAYITYICENLAAITNAYLVGTYRYSITKTYIPGRGEGGGSCLFLLGFFVKPF